MIFVIDTSQFQCLHKMSKQNFLIMFMTSLKFKVWSLPIWRVFFINVKSEFSLSIHIMFIKLFILLFSNNWRSTACISIYVKVIKKNASVFCTNEIHFNLEWVIIIIYGFKICIYIIRWKPQCGGCTAYIWKDPGSYYSVDTTVETSASFHCQ